MLQIQQPFPFFSMQNQNGITKSLGDYAGHWLVLYTYPKDDTPGCTIQAKDFTALAQDFAKIGVHVVGVSKDSVASHKKFCHKYDFQIDLLSDPDKTHLDSWGVMTNKIFGALGISRTTFIIDPKGILHKLYEKVKAEGHAQLVLEDMRTRVTEKK